VTELVLSGRIFDLIVGLLLLEGLAFSFYRWVTGRGIAHADLWLSLAAGAGLLFAASTGRRCKLGLDRPVPAVGAGRARRGHEPALAPMSQLGFRRPLVD
jgi:hypothetical protein